MQMRMRPHTRTQCTNGNQCSECHPVALLNGHATAVTTGAIRSIIQFPAEVIEKIISYLSFKEISQLRRVSRRFNEICASMLNSTFHRLQTHMLQRFQTIKSQMPRRESLRRNHPLAREADIVETLHMRLTLLQMTFGKHIERKHVCFFAGEILDEVQRILFYIRQTPSLGRAFKVTDELFDLSTMAMEYFKEHIEPTLPEITYFGAEFLDFATPFTTPTKRRSQSGSTSAASLLGLDSPCSSRASVAGSDVWSTTSGSTVRGRGGHSGGNAGTGGGRAGSLASGASGSRYRDQCDEDDDDDIDEDDDDFFTAPPPPPPANAQTTMVLRKRIRRIRQGMKKYNTQLVEVKRELKTCKSKMESQTKQVQDYSQRLEEYDKKFEESSRKFQTLLTELNKCKTELQYWRSKSTQLLSLPTTCAECEAPLLPVGFAGSGLTNPDGSPFVFGDLATLDLNDLKTLANQGVYPASSDASTIVPGTSTSADAVASSSSDGSGMSGTTSMKTRSRPNSPSGKVGSSSGSRVGPGSPIASGSASATLGSIGRKRRSRDDDAETEMTRKSLRANQSGCVATSTRAKRPKLNSQQ